MSLIWFIWGFYIRAPYGVCFRSHDPFVCMNFLYKLINWFFNIYLINLFWILVLGRVMPTWVIHIPYSNIFHSPVMGMTHPINQHFKLAQEIHTDEHIVWLEAHTVGSSYIETSNRPHKRHQPQLSYSKSALTYPKQFCLHTIEYI